MKGVKQWLFPGYVSLVGYASSLLVLLGFLTRFDKKVKLFPG